MMNPLFRQSRNERRYQTQRQADVPQSINPSRCSGWMERCIKPGDHFRGAGTMFVNGTLDVKELMNYHVDELVWVDLQGLESLAHKCRDDCGK